MSYSQRVSTFIRSPALVYFSAAALGRVGGIVLIPLYTRQLSREEFSTLALASTLQSLLPIVFSLGLATATAKVYFDTPKGEDPEARTGVIARAAVLMTAALATLTAAAITVFWPDSSSSGFSPYRLLLVTGASLGTALTMIPDTLYRARKQPWLVATLNVTTFFSTVSLGLLFVLRLGRGLDGVLEASALAALLTGAWGVIFSWFILRTRAGQRAEVSLIKTLKFSLPFVPHFLANWAFGAGDRWALKSVHQEQLLGLYSVGQQLASPVTMLSTAVNDVQAANMGSEFREHGLASLRSVLPKDIRRAVMLAAIPYGALLLSWPLLKLMLGPNFEHGLILLPAVGFAGLFEAAYYPSVNVLFYAGQTRLIPIITIASAVIGVTLAASLTWAFGMAGLIAARLLSSAARALLCWFFARRAL